MTVDTLGRALQLYRRTATTRSAVLLVVANLIPLVGVVLFGWSLWTILVLYWVENGIVGFWTVPRILLAQGSTTPTLPELPDAAARAATGGDPTATADLQAAWQQARDAQIRAAAGVEGPLGANPLLGRVRVFGKPVSSVSGAGRSALAIFFVMHYGIFWFVHGIFIFLLPQFLGSNPTCAGPSFPGGAPPPFPLPADLTNSCTGAFGDIVWSNVLIAGVALFISHGASFLFNYVGRAEYLATTPMRQMGAPYGRVMILHVTIIFGAFAVAALGAPIGALLILVALKTIFDLTLHLRERHQADARIPADTAYGQVIRGG